MKHIIEQVYNNDSDPLAVPFLGKYKYSAVDKDTDELLKEILAQPSPRKFRCHLPFSFMRRQVVDDKARFIIVMRNPKDTLVSFYHFYRSSSPFGKFPGTWDEFFEIMKQKRLSFGDVIDHYQGWWEQRHLSNVLIVKYEDMKKDLCGAIRQVAKFCDQESV